MKKLIAFIFLSLIAFSSFAQTKINPAKLLQGTSGAGSLFLKSDNSGNVSFSNNLNGNVINGSGTATLSTDIPNFGQISTAISNLLASNPTWTGFHTFNIPINAAGLKTNASLTEGYIQLNKGNSTYSGYVDFYSPDQNRIAYIGFTQTGGGLSFVSSNNQGFEFSGGRLYVANQKVTGLANATNPSDAVAYNQLSNLNAAWLTSGTIPNNRLSSDVILMNTTPTISGLIVSHATSPLLQFSPNGVAAPTFNTRSLGSKVVWYPSVSASTVDYATGIESGVLWNSVPATTSSFRWYGGTTLAASLSGAGAFTTNGTITGENLISNGSISAVGNIQGLYLTSTTPNGIAPLFVTSSTMVTNLNADQLDGQHGSYYQNASNISSGTLPDIRLSSNIPLKNATNTYSQIQTFSSDIVVNSQIITSIASDLGGKISINNPSKTGDIASQWAIFNMGGAYGNGLNFWSYNQSGIPGTGGQGRTFTISDDGTITAPRGRIYAQGFNSTVATGTAPLIVNSQTLVSNLNANFIRGLDSNSIAQRNQVNTFTQRNNFTNFVNIAGPSAIAAAAHTNYTDAADRIYTMQGDGNVRSITYQGLINANQSNDTFAMSSAAQTFNLSSNLVNTIDVSMHAASFDSLDIRLPATQFDDNQTIAITTSNKRMVMSQGDKIKITSSAGDTLLEIVNDPNSLISSKYEINTAVLGYISMQIQYSKKRNLWRLISFENSIDQ